MYNPEMERQTIELSKWERTLARKRRLAFWRGFWGVVATLCFIVAAALGGEYEGPQWHITLGLAIDVAVFALSVWQLNCYQERYDKFCKRHDL